MADIETDGKNTTPIWVGWNSNLIPRDDETQKIWYLPQINMSPISHAVVVERFKKITTYSSRMWETMHCCNLWFGNSQNGIPNLIRRKTKVWQHLYSTSTISSGAVSCLRSIYWRIWWTSHTKRIIIYY